MKVKICGMKYPDNIRELAKLQPDFAGFIFYKKSPRYVAPESILKPLADVHDSIKRVGVFVKSPIDEVIKTCRQLNLDYAQLHGGEDVEYCQQIKLSEIGVIKVFHVGEGFSLNDVEPWLGTADYFLFDTSTKKYGGSGKHFDWTHIENYPYDIPFLLSGGISERDIEAIHQMTIPQLAGIDANSQLEIKPGLKDMVKVKQLIERTRHELYNR